MSASIEGLTTLASLDEVSVQTVGDGDYHTGVVPYGCEVVLDMTKDGRTQRMHLTRADGELIIECLHQVLHPNDNRKSPVARLWEELDDVMDFLRADDSPEPEDRARAKALALALALLTQPYSEEPNLDPIRAEAAERWEARQ